MELLGVAVGRPARVVADLSIGSYTGQNQAAWSLTGTRDYLAVGGEFPEVNGVAQQGLVRFARAALAPNRQGPADTDLALQAGSPSAGTVDLTWTTLWDSDNETLAYSVLRDEVRRPEVFGTPAKSRFYRRPALQFQDTGVAAGSHTYQVRVVDPYGNAWLSPAVSVTVAAGAAPAPPGPAPATPAPAPATPARPPKPRGVRAAPARPVPRPGSICVGLTRTIPGWSVGRARRTLNADKRRRFDSYPGSRVRHRPAPRSVTARERAPARPLAVIVLAAGGGTRMKSKTDEGAAPARRPQHDRPRPGRRPARSSRSTSSRSSATGASRSAPHILDLVPDALLAVQETQEGTGHAVRVALDALRDAAGTTHGTVLVTTGDTPLLRGRDACAAFVDDARGRGARGQLLTGEVADPFGYGRILRDDDGDGRRRSSRRRTPTAEQARDPRDQLAASSPSTATFLADALARIGNDNAKGEYYLTDVVGIARADGRAVGRAPHRRRDADRGRQRPRPAGRRSAAELNRRIARPAGCATGVTVDRPGHHLDRRRRRARRRT